jgi:hypothetical protein
MHAIRRSILSTAVCAAVLAAGAQAASATVLYVNGTTGADTNTCLEATAPCKTIGAAITKANTAPEASTVSVAAGVYKEAEKALLIQLPGEDGISIVGAGSGAGGTVVEGLEEDEQATFEVQLPGGTAHLAHLSLVTPVKDKEAAIETEANLTAEDVVVDVRDAGPAPGITSGQVGSLTLQGVAVTMEGGTTGKAISGGFGPMSLNGVNVAVGAGSEASGIESQFGAVTIQNSTVSLFGSKSNFGIGDAFGAMALTNVTVSQAGNHAAIASVLPTSDTLDNVTVSMSEPETGEAAIRQQFGSGSFENVTVSGAWKGPAMALVGTAFTVSDSHLSAGANNNSEVLGFTGASEGPGLLLQRTVIGAPQLSPVGVLLDSGNGTLDSSTVLGGKVAIRMVNEVTRAKLLTVAASTLDAGVVGAADEGDHDILLAGKDPMSANLVGSIAVEPQAAENEPDTLTCVDSDVPNQAQAVAPSSGAINCATGLNGDSTTPPSVLFAAPTTSLQLAPATAAIDSVPAGAIVLPFGLTSSATDLLGAPRDVDGNGDCIAVQDRGAEELQGHAAPCPPVKGVITALSLSPMSFLAAPTGAAVTAKTKYGTLIKYDDSQAASTTFTITVTEPGRKHGKSCVKPSHKNRKGKHCTRTVTLGNFSHTDIAGANSLRFTGRLHSHKLHKGAYHLQAVPRNSAGAGTPVKKTFNIK